MEPSNRPDVPIVPARLAALPRDRRGFVVPAEAGWEDSGPVIQGLGHHQTFTLALTRACAICGFPMEPGQTVWRLFNQAEAAGRREYKRELYEPANPGHLVCMLYSSQVCPYWSRSGARLGKDSLVAPGARRGSLVALMGFSDYELLLPVGVPITSAAFIYVELTEDIRFREPAELADMYEAERVRDTVPPGRRAYWTNTPEDVRAIMKAFKDVVRTTERASGRGVFGPNGGGPHYAFQLPLR